MQKIIYFDNAATTWPKPGTVIKAMSDAVQFYGGNPGRGTHRLALAADELLFESRMTAAGMFNAEPENVIFTLNATHALNMAIKGLAYSGCHILIDNFAHNAAYRPALALQNYGCVIETYDASGSDDETIDNIKSKICSKTGLVIATHHSNICSKLVNIEKIGALCKRNDIPFVVDASQSAGSCLVDFKKTRASAICMPGHKGLYGPMGCGIMICDPETRFKTIIEGGAGINSKDTTMPAELPERLEAGTVALPAIAGLKAGIEWVKKIGVDNVHAHTKMLSETFLREIGDNPKIKIHGPHDGAVISFSIKGSLPSEVCDKLNSKGICVRSGYHCAPLAHKTLGTEENGTVRVSFSYGNRISEVKLLTGILNDEF